MRFRQENIVGLLKSRLAYFLFRLISAYLAAYGLITIVDARTPFHIETNSYKTDPLKLKF